MTYSLNDYHFESLQKTHQREIDILEKYKIVNDFLNKNDWLFISPIFFQGFELNQIFELSKKQGNHKKKITEIIARKFYYLNWTATFVDGYCSRCNHILPFLKSIEQSIILAFQKDYEGSVKTLIPIIEGILRKYLVTEKGYDNNNISYEILKKSFELIKIDIITANQERMKNFYDENKTRILFSREQLEELLKFDNEYYGTWFSFVKDFIEKSFYLNTNSKSITNEVNRHSILHKFGDDFSYDFENFIKILFVIQFLTWAFLRKEGKSLLNKINSRLFLDKLISYKNIIRISQRLNYEKHILYKDKRGYNLELLKHDFKPTIDLPLKLKHRILIALSRWFDKFLWVKGMK